MVPSSTRRSAGRWIVSRLGGNPAGALGLDLGTDEGLRRWLAAACLGRDHSWRALEGSELEVCRATPGEVAAVLEAADHPRPERAAGGLVRAFAALEERYGGSLERLAGEAEDFEDLAGRLAGLAPGIGVATVTRFLRPLRDVWPLAAELPLSPAARAAAVHLGLIREGEDEEGEPGALRAALAREPDPPPLCDVESALDALGRRACLRNRPDRCPLAQHCPRGRA